MILRAYIRILEYNKIHILRFCNFSIHLFYHEMKHQKRFIIIDSVFNVTCRIFSRKNSVNTSKKLKNNLEFQNELNTESYNISDCNSITDGDPNKLKILKLVQLEIDFSMKCPNLLKTEDWRTLISLDKRHDRIRYLAYLWLREKILEETKHRKIRKRLKYLAFLESKTLAENSNDASFKTIHYGLNSVTLFYQLNKQKVKTFYNFKLCQAMIFGPEIILDMSYESYMSDEELKKCAKQIIFMLSSNRNQINPFHLILCNVKENSILLSLLNRSWSSLLDHSFPFTCTDKNYVDLFPKEKLVYLSPHAENELEYYDPYSVYIIGAFVDLKRNPIVSSVKAEECGLRMAKLPLDKYLNWQAGPKSLALYVVLKIMNDIKDGKSWTCALGHISSIKAQKENYKIEKKLNPAYETICERNRRLLLYDLLLGKK